MSAVDPEDYSFMIKWKNKLDIGDANIHILRKDNLKEVIISFKQIYINTYNIISMDFNDTDDSLTDTLPTLIFRHERFQLWESEIQGFLTKKSLTFVTVNRQGINIVGLDPTEKRKEPVKDSEGFERILHTLESMNYLKVEDKNSLYFDCSKQDDRKIVV